MKSIFDSNDNQELIERITRLSFDSQAQWGVMTVDQMMSHCIAPIDFLFENQQMKANFLFRLLGRMMKNKILNEPDFKKNSPTAPSFIRTERYDFDETKKKLTEKVISFKQGHSVIKSNNHPFFGKMTNDDWDKLMWKHLDHHLKQFGV
ncbi:DUF1569 domain-containing protein [Flavobacterium sp.]|uniref:DUF1569 domain-containing protein n=1 Tax=Flavobacterium sp. TaxID=239 RepID=UPI003D6AFE4C